MANHRPTPTPAPIAETPTPVRTPKILVVSSGLTPRPSSISVTLSDPLTGEVRHYSEVEYPSGETRSASVSYSTEPTAGHANE